MIFQKPRKSKIIDLVERRLNILKSRGLSGVVKPVLKDGEVLESFSDLHSKFVVVPIDKASSNVAIICKRYYIHKLLNKIVVPGNASPTSKLSGPDPNHVILTTLYDLRNLVSLLKRDSRPYLSCIGFLRCIIILLELVL